MPKLSQMNNFMKFACPDPDELFCLDWEDNGGNVMSAADAKTWITQVENQLGRPGECVIYSGNTAKEHISGKDSFFGRPAQPAEMAPIYVFLASRLASFVSGEVYGATGGRTPL